MMRCDEILGLSAAGFHRVAYTEWGAGDAERCAIAVHGLTRNGRDFDPLAAVLAAAGFRVACPDIVGRGRSDRLGDPAGYAMPQYLADMTALVARLDRRRIDWIGTSMGGLIGMTMAARPGTPIRRLVLNDVGPFIPKAALEVIAGYVGQDPLFADRAAGEAYLRFTYGAFGALDDDEWRRVAETGLVETPGDGFRLAYDPAIANAFRSGPIEDVDLWSLWDAIACPVLLLRGAESGLLLPETAEEMTRRGPKAELVTFEGCGHAPWLWHREQTGVIRDWLLRTPAAP